MITKVGLKKNRWDILGSHVMLLLEPPFFDIDDVEVSSGYLCLRRRGISTKTKEPRGQFVCLSQSDSCHCCLVPIFKGTRGKESEIKRERKRQTRDRQETDRHRHTHTDRERERERQTQRHKHSRQTQADTGKTQKTTGHSPNFFSICIWGSGGRTSS